MTAKEWDKIWKEFDSWYEEAISRVKVCKKCHHIERSEIDWEDQKAMIECVVNDHLIQERKKRK